LGNKDFRSELGEVFIGELFEELKKILVVSAGEGLELDDFLFGPLFDAVSNRKG